MGITKGTISGNDYVGAFVSAAEDYVLAGRNLTHGDEKLIHENLGAKVIKLTIDGSELVGIYAVCNSHGILVPDMARRDEIELLKKELPHMKISMMKTDLNALKNNMLVNDKIAMVNPEYSGTEMKLIGEALDVEVLRFSTGGFHTVGANNILTNKGLVLNNRTTEREEEEAMKIVGSVDQTTANMGSPNIGLSVIANSKGLIIGAATTGYELTRITEALGL